ncbi:hypothetical protein HF313_20900 [Massilia atriviolacea]|uniref:Uncharacterized protein n=1 Tax=Massilia atriviolacea TaxID=2495579 RepID=A0A430HRY6_9BURK|nr:hypothetical protein [Massilia atriviolacea]RSZ60257.1 hypothetical protein EJB06_03790 [Massilia atriviolacea]
MRILRHLLLAAAIAPAIAHAAPKMKPAARPVTSFFPQLDLGRFLADNFDLASVRSSLAPRRTPDLRTFADFGMLPTNSGDDGVTFDGERWLYQLRVVRRADINNDGIEDLEVCFTDRAKGASYDASQSLLVSRYSDETYAVALRYESEACGPAAKSSPARTRTIEVK